MTRAVCICVPARNEADRLPRLLDALAAQDLPGTILVALCINNSDDGSAEAALRAAAAHGSRLALSIDECRFADRDAHAGAARRRAMACGVALLDDADDAVLLATDADCRPPPRWIGANLAALDTGVDIVGGRIDIDESEPLGEAAAALRARWDRYWAAVRAIEDAVDPCAWDPAPRHGDHTGASLAITVARYRAAGGVPAIPLGEDRALVAAAIASGGKLAHPDAVWTRVSPRRDGRAPGGMADAMAQLHRAALTGAPTLVPALRHWHDRAAWRRDVRRREGARHIALAEPLLAAMPHDQPLEAIVR